jgi:hypothetical protein
METYQLAPKGFVREKRRLITISVFFFAGALFYFVWAINFDQTLSFSSKLLAFLIAIAIGISFTLFGIKQRRLVYFSYRLTLSPQTLTEEHSLQPQISIPFEQISHLEEFSSEGLKVVIAEKKQPIWILPSLNDYETVKAQLSQIRKLETKSSLKLPALLWLLNIAMMAFGGLIVALLLSQQISTVVQGFWYLLIFVCFSWRAVDKTYREQHLKRLGIIVIVPFTVLLIKLISLLAK